MYPLHARQVASWEARPIHIRALVASPPLRSDGERPHRRHSHAGELADAQGIKGMRLLDSKAGAVPPRAPTAPGQGG